MDRDDGGNDVDAFGDLVNFYGSEVVSHGGLSIGVMIALLTLFQIRPSLDISVFESFLWVVVAGGVYVVLRILWYGSLSGIVMNSLKRQYQVFLTQSDDGTFLNGEFMAHARANRFIGHKLNIAIANYPRQRWRVLYADKWMVRIISIAAGIAGVALSLPTLYDITPPFQLVFVGLSLLTLGFARTRYTLWRAKLKWGRYGME